MLGACMWEYMLNAMECANPDLQVRQNIALHHLLHCILLPRYGPLGVPHEGSSNFSGWTT